VTFPKLILMVTMTAMLAFAGLGLMAALPALQNDGPLEPFALVGAASVVLLGAMFHYRKEILEGLQNLFGGGPRTPSHPLPADDSLILRRRRFDATFRR